MYKKFGAVALAAALLFSSTAFAAGTNQGALAPGKPATVSQAQHFGSHTLLLLLGVGLVAGGLAAALTGGGHGTTTTSTTGTPH